MKMKPLILINFKTYKEASTNKSLKLAQEIAKIKKRKYQIAISPPIISLKEISQKTNLAIYAQHTDFQDYGSHTGSILPKEIKLAGAVGTLLNHSEKKLPYNILKQTFLSCKKAKLKTIICASTIFEMKKIAKLKPNYIAYEPKKLIGGNVSVTQSKPKFIIKAIKTAKSISPKTKLLVGAGIHSKEDLQQALEMGAKGVLLAHAVVQTKNTQKFLKEFLR